MRKITSKVIEQQTAEYLANGGQIERVENALCRDSLIALRYNEKGLLRYEDNGYDVKANMQPTVKKRYW